MNPATPDPVIDEIRAARRQISSRFGHDPRRLVAHYIRIQERGDEGVGPPDETAEGLVAGHETEDQARSPIGNPLEGTRPR